jgi:hypothetical protein
MAYFMNSRTCLTGLGIIFLSLLSTLNSINVREENINELSEHEPLLNLALNLMNILAVAPELIYNIKHNARLPHLWHKITTPPTEEKHQVIKKMTRTFHLLLGALPTVVAHGVLFYDANEVMLKKQYQLLSDEKLNNQAEMLAYALSCFGATQHWLQGAIELAEGAVTQPSMRFFCNSGLVVGNSPCDWAKWVFQNLTYDVGVNSLLLLAVYAEFGLFYLEFLKKITANPNRLPNVDVSFLNLISISLSLMSASMYLGHEGQSFLKIKTALENEVRKFQRGEYNAISLEKLLKKQLYLLSCLSHAMIHSLVRYEALMSLTDSRFFSLTSAGISGLSRLAMLCIENDTHTVINLADLQKESIKFTADLRGHEMMYEMFFISVIGVTSLSYEELDLINPYVVMTINSLPALLSEGFLHLISHIYSGHHATHTLDFIIDAVTTPLFLTYLATATNNSFCVSDLMDEATGMIILSLLLRHAQRKLSSYPEVTSAFQWAQEKMIALKNFILPPPAENPEIINEHAPLLPGTRLRPESYRERASSYLYHCATSAYSWCQLFSRVSNDSHAQDFAERNYHSRPFV